MLFSQTASVLIVESLCMVACGLLLNKPAIGTLRLKFRHGQVLLLSTPTPTCLDKDLAALPTPIRPTHLPI